MPGRLPIIALLCLTAALLAAWIDHHDAAERHARHEHEAAAVAAALDLTDLAAIATADPRHASAEYAELERQLGLLRAVLPGCEAIVVDAIDAVDAPLCEVGTGERADLVDVVVPLFATTPARDRYRLVMRFDPAVGRPSPIRSARVPALAAAIAVAVYLLSIVVIARWLRRTGRPPRDWRDLERGVAVVVVGAMLTFALFWIVREGERRSRHDSFQQLAGERTEALDRVLRSLRNVELNALARYYAASEHVTSQEFADFARLLVSNEVVRSWLWIEADPAGGGSSTVTRVAPDHHQDGLLGLDLGAVPQLAGALQTTRRVRRPLAAAWPADGAGDAAEHALIVLRPVFAANRSDSLLGHAAAILPINVLMDNVMWNDAATVTLAELRPDEAPLLMSTSQPGDAEPDSAFVASHPLLAFGKAMLVTAVSNPSFEQLQPVRASKLLLVAGLLLSAALGLLYTLLFQKRAQLEWLVAQRTAELIDAQHHMEQAVRGADLGTWDLDVATGTLELNERWARLLACDLAAVPRRLDDWATILGPDGLDAVKRAVGRLRQRDNEFLEAELPLTRHDGEVVWTLWRGRSIAHDHAGAPRRVCGTCLDITGRKRAAEERERLRDQLKQGQKLEAIGRLAAGVAHDLNNLLSPVIGYSQLLLEGPVLRGEPRAYADSILAAGLRARDLVGQLLAYGRRQALEVGPVDLNRTVAEFEPLLRRTVPESITMRVILSTDDATVLADRGQVEQVLMNLTVNAAQAMPDGGTLTIETSVADLDDQYTRLHPEMDPGRYLMLAVSDTGIGMDVATREKIFEPFFTTKGALGTGMGLATVFGIVKQHGGNIWVYSEPGKGSTFKVFLPAGIDQADAAIPARAAPTRTTGHETILLVEDNDDVRSLARTILERHGYTVLAAANGAEALRIARAHDGPIHLLLTDVVMPEMNGRELFRDLAARRPGLAVLYMSGYTDNVIAVHGVLDEGVQFLQKPFSIEGLVLRVREVIDR